MGMGMNILIGNPMGMGICQNIRNGNGKEWEVIAREREGMGLSEPLSVTSTSHPLNDDVFQK
jgi:hypothetical protein